MSTSPDTKQPKKRGPAPKGYVDTHIFLPPEIIEWGKTKPDGLSSLIRRLCIEERDRERQRRTPAATPG